jgi:hypothetical protein
MSGGYYSFLSHMLVSEGNLCTASLDLFLSLLFY